jgi:hypothetical protein
MHVEVATSNNRCLSFLEHPSAMLCRDFRCIKARSESDKNEGSVDAPIRPTPAEPAPALDEEDDRPGLKPGQGTAIVTGAISLILGIAYIAITIALDSRGGGGSLQPPPPEAFMQ